KVRSEKGGHRSRFRQPLDQVQRRLAEREALVAGEVPTEFVALREQVHEQRGQQHQEQGDPRGGTLVHAWRPPRWASSWAANRSPMKVNVPKKTRSRLSITPRPMLAKWLPVLRYRKRLPTAPVALAATTAAPKWKKAMNSQARTYAVIWLLVRLLAKSPSAM